MAIQNDAVEYLSIAMLADGRFVFGGSQSPENNLLTALLYFNPQLAPLFEDAIHVAYNKWGEEREEEE